MSKGGRRALWIGLGAVGMLGLALLLLVNTTWGRRFLVTTLDSGYATTNATGEPKAIFDGTEVGQTRLEVRLVPVLEGIRQPTDIQPVPGHPGLLAVLEKEGRASLLTLATGERRDWFRADVLTRSEQGLLGLAFHPEFARNGRFFVHLSVQSGGPVGRLAEYRVDPGSLASPKVHQTILEVAQPYPNHNGGQVAFGPDGMLYLALGDGGYRDDPHGHGQNRGTLLGSILRLDVDRAEGKLPYGIPPDNPFVGVPGARPEIWAYGLRNPWRFDVLPDGRLVVGDVGQDLWEEITVVERGSNHGWAHREGAHCFPPGKSCVTEGLVEPIHEYPRAAGVSVTGGRVYRGSQIPALRGQYLFADFATGRLWALPLPKQGAGPGLLAPTSIAELGRFPISIAAFGEDASGELYVADFGGGRVLRLAPASP